MMDYDIRDGRTYMYLKKKPLYSFGYGLSYTSFAYSNLRVRSTQPRTGGEASISFDLRNTGARDDDEVVQLYVTHLNSKVARPIEELKGFDRVHLLSGETKTITLPLKARALAYWDEAANRFTLERDPVELRIGASSDNIRLRKTIDVSP